MLTWLIGFKLLLLHHTYYSLHMLLLRAYLFMRIISGQPLQRSLNLVPIHSLNLASWFKYNMKLVIFAMRTLSFWCLQTWHFWGSCSFTCGWVYCICVAVSSKLCFWINVWEYFQMLLKTRNVSNNKEEILKGQLWTGHHYYSRNLNKFR